MSLISAVFHDALIDLLGIQHRYSQDEKRYATNKF
jgi:hypothetical protein